jgi:predicted PurR-regulated permease PerM
VTSLLLLALLYGVNERLTSRLSGRRALAAVASIFVLMAAILGPIYFVVRLFVSEIRELQGKLAPVVDQARADLQAALVDAGVGSELALLVDEVSATLYQLATQIGLQIVGGTINALLYGIVIVFVLFFLLRDTPSMLRTMRDLSPIGPDHVDFLARRFRYVTVGVLKGVVVVAIVQSLIGGATLALVGVPGVWLWTILMSVLSLIPLFGTWMVMYPLAFIEIARGNVVGGVIIVLVTLLVITTVDNVLRPILVGQQAKMHTLVALLSTVGGMMVFGVMGVFIGPVLAAMFVAMLELYREELMPPADAL